MKLVPITRNDFRLWKQMRIAIYQALDDAYHDQEMRQLLESPDWFCYFLENDEDETLDHASVSRGLMGLVELSARNIVDNCLSSPVAYLEGLYLLPKYRGNGKGKQAMTLIIDWCQQRGFRELATDAELDNTLAQGFYRGLGFKETDRVVEYRLDIIGD